MQFESRITWEKLALELELLTVEDPSSLVPLLIGINSVLWPNEPHEWAFRTINFMGYELAARCEGYEEQDRYHILNDYFFDLKGFQFHGKSSADCNENDWLIKPILTKKSGAPLTLALLYLHLATHVDLPIYLVHMHNHCILKWVRSGKSNFIDLSNGGRLMSEEQMLAFLNRSVGNSDERNGKEDSILEILPGRRVLQRYLEQLIQVYDKETQLHELHMCFNVLLKLDGANLRYLGCRALLRQRLGYVKEAMGDLKRYFSFVDRAHAPSELQTAYYELKSMAEFHAPPTLARTELLH